jgi:hypothetical protein
MRSKIVVVLALVAVVLSGTVACKAPNRGRFGAKTQPTATQTPTHAPETATSFVDYPACLRNTGTGGVFNPPCVLDLKDSSYLLEFEDGHGTYFKLCAGKTDKNCVRRTGNRFVVVS